MKISIMGQVLDKSIDSGKFLFILSTKLLKRLFSVTVRASVGVSAILSLVLNVFLPKKNGRRYTHQIHPDLAARGIIINLLNKIHSHALDSSVFKALLPYQNKLVKKVLWDFKYYLKPYALRFCGDVLFDELLAEMSDRVNAIPLSKPRLVVHCPSSTFFKGEKSFDHMKELLCVIESEQNLMSPFFTACVHAIVPRSATDSVHDTAQNMAQQTTPKAQHLSSRAERLILAQSRFIFSKEFIKFMKTEISEGAIGADGADNAKGNAKGAKYTPLGCATVSGLSDTIYCIDDVTTTGATFTAVTKLFKDKFKSTAKNGKSVEVRCIALSH